MAERPTPPEFEKPAVLYHASPNRNIDRFEPRQESVRDPEEGPVIFASPDEAYVSMFIIRAGDDWTRRGRFGADEPWHMIISDEKRFRAEDKGGAIYHLSSASFHSDPERNMPGIEWASKEPVEPTGKEEYDSALSAMLGHGVEVYFVTPEVFTAIQTSDDHGSELLSHQAPVGAMIKP